MTMKTMLLILILSLVPSSGEAETNDLRSLVYALNCVDRLGGNAYGFLFESPGRTNGKVSIASGPFTSPTYEPVRVASITRGEGLNPVWIYDISFRDEPLSNGATHRLHLLREDDGGPISAVSFYRLERAGEMTHLRTYGCRSQGVSRPMPATSRNRLNVPARGSSGKINRERHN